MNQQPQTIAVQYVSDLTYHMIIICAIHAPNTSRTKKDTYVPAPLLHWSFAAHRIFLLFVPLCFRVRMKLFDFSCGFFVWSWISFSVDFTIYLFYRYIYQFFHIYRYNMCANITYVHSYIYTYRSVVHLSFPHIDSSGKKSPSDMLKDASPCSEVTLARSQRCSEHTTGLTYKETFPVEIWQLGICSKTFHVFFKFVHLHEYVT